MGIETAIIYAALTAVSAASQMSAANKQAKQQVAEGNLAMRNKAIETKRKAASAQVSFLNSGLTLDGTPMGAILGILDTGKEDVTQIGSVYNARSKNIMSTARSKVISDIASSFAGASLGGLGGMGGGGSSPSLGANGAPWGANAGITDATYGSGFN